MTQQNDRLGKWKYQVITRIPDPEKGETGNLYDEVPWWLVEGTGEIKDGEWVPDRVERDYSRGSVRMPVFEIGEVLIVNDYGREIVGHGRKADKWDVDYEEFDTIEEAVVRAREVSFT